MKNQASKGKNPNRDVKLNLELKDGDWWTVFWPHSDLSIVICEAFKLII